MSDAMSGMKSGRLGMCILWGWPEIYLSMNMLDQCCLAMFFTLVLSDQKRKPGAYVV